MYKAYKTDRSRKFQDGKQLLIKTKGQRIKNKIENKCVKKKKTQEVKHTIMHESSSTNDNTSVTWHKVVLTTDFDCKADILHSFREPDVPQLISRGQ